MIPEVSEVIGGTTYTFRFSARATITIEQEFGCRITNLSEKIGKIPSVTDTGKIVRACVRKDGHPLSEEEYEALLDQIDIEELADILERAMKAAQSSKPAKEGDTGKN